MRDFHLPGRSPVLATNGICATSHPLAAEAAVDILKQGGNAMDAAIAGAVMLGVCEPAMCGIGGDLFALVSPAGTDEIHAMNGSGRAPAGASADALRAEGHDTIPRHGPDAVTIPGAMDAICDMSRRWGHLGLADSLAPAIHYMDEGVPVAPRVAFDWVESEPNLQGAAREHYLVSGKIPKVGDLFKLPGNAEVLRRVARHGRDAFYTGEIAEDMLATLGALNGVHSPEDFAATACTPTDPVSGIYKGQELFEHPPNGQGATAILMLNILDHFDLGALDPFGAERAHLEAEAARLAYDARNRFIADPEHTSGLDHMLSADTAARLAALIDPERAQSNTTQLTEAVHKDTIYITVVDRDRMAVSLIYSIFDSFGSGLASEKFGILFQSRGTGFNLTPGHANELGGGKRPMHTIIPAMLRRNGRVFMPFGVMGGQYQPNGHVRVLTNMIDFGMDPQSALDAPRSFAHPDGTLHLERGYGDDVRAALAAKGHKITTPRTPIGGAQTIQIHENGTLEAASDPRKDGCAIGY